MSEHNRPWLVLEFLALLAQVVVIGAVDDRVATVGSANMDMRSFTLNYETKAFVFSKSLCDDMARQFETDLAAASEVTRDWERWMGMARQLVRGVAKLLSPLL